MHSVQSSIILHQGYIREALRLDKQWTNAIGSSSSSSSNLQVHLLSMPVASTL